MKKIIISLFLLFFTFSCQNIEIEKTKQNKIGTGKIENNSGSISEEQKEAEQCAEKSPFETGKYSISWAFKNKNNNKCYYLGFSEQFFLVDEDLKNNISKNLDNDIKTGYIIQNDSESREELIDRLNFIFLHLKYNLLYGEEAKGLVNYAGITYSFQEVPMIALFDKENLLDRYLEKFKELNIILPENYVKIKEKNFSPSKYIKKWLEYRSGESKLLNEKNFVPVPEYFYEIDFNNFYNILREKQQKELEIN